MAHVGVMSGKIMFYEKQYFNLIAIVVFLFCLFSNEESNTYDFAK
jgi:hypothetical protein